MTLTGTWWQLAWSCAWAGFGGSAMVPLLLWPGQNLKGSRMLGSAVLGTVTFLSLGRGPRPGLGLLASHLAQGGILEVAVGLLCPPCEDMAPPPLQHMGLGGTSRGEPRRDKQGHCVKAGKVVRTRSLNLN